MVWFGLAEVAMSVCLVGQCFLLLFPYKKRGQNIPWTKDWSPLKIIVVLYIIFKELITFGNSVQKVCHFRVHWAARPSRAPATRFFAVQTPQCFRPILNRYPSNNPWNLMSQNNPLLDIIVSVLLCLCVRVSVTLRVSSPWILKKGLTGDFWLKTNPNK